MRVGPDIEYGRTGLVLDINDVRGTGMDMLVKRAIAVLERHYQGWGWTIAADHPGLMIYVMATKLDTEWGYALKVLKIMHDPTDSWALRAGGGYLERFGFLPLPFRRQRARYMAAYRFNGRILPNVADSPDKSLRDKMAIRHEVSQGKAQIITDPLAFQRYHQQMRMAA